MYLVSLDHMLDYYTLKAGVGSLARINADRKGRLKGRRRERNKGKGRNFGEWMGGRVVRPTLYHRPAHFSFRRVIPT